MENDGFEATGAGPLCGAAFRAYVMFRAAIINEDENTSGASMSIKDLNRHGSRIGTSQWDKIASIDFLE